MKHFEFEYGAGTMGADLPDYTDEFIALAKDYYLYL